MLWLLSLKVEGKENSDQITVCDRQAFLSALLLSHGSSAISVRQFLTQNNNNDPSDDVSANDQGDGLGLLLYSVTPKMSGNMLLRDSFRDFFFFTPTIYIYIFI